MIDQLNLKKFNEVYDKTYNNTLRFVVCKCSDIEDVNDIIQEVYIELYKKIANIENIQNVDSYIIGIAKNKIRKHYGLLYKFKTLSLNSRDEHDLEIIDNIPDVTDIESITINGIDLEIIWEQLKKKRIEIQRIFYLYYNMDFTIKEIAMELNLSESYIKNSLYRTLKELQKYMGKVGNEDV